MRRILALLLSTSLTLVALLSIPSLAAAQSPFSSVKMELTVTQDGVDWKADAKLNVGGNELITPARDLKLNGNELSFFIELEGAQVKFAGRLSENKLTGTLEAIEKGARVATGTWTLQPADSVAANSLAGKWIGSFSAQMVPAQQVDPNFDTRVTQPAFTSKHPKVLFDEAHNNIHTATGLYKPFADLITNDGFVVVSNKEKFTANTLAGYDILVIANASGPRGQRAMPAFTDEESDAVRDWVSAGGALLFISDHAPMGAAAEILAKRFAVDMSKGYTDDSSSKDREVGDILFSRANKLLGDHAITRGRNSREKINRVVTFTGQSLKGPAGAIALLNLPSTAVDTFPQTKTSQPAAGRVQGMAMTVGKGRVVVLGEAGMLSAQIDNKGRVFGMNYPETDNRQFALNIMHWLARLLK
ncbi:MAG TPA: hypothetical protein VJT71_12870 [Pyrinomonadaceae bacterium]|nr:hypothetical protein [Pyrinomonadaceae bacterium]